MNSRIDGSKIEQQYDVWIGTSFSQVNTGQIMATALSVEFVNRVGPLSQVGIAFLDNKTITYLSTANLPANGVYQFPQQIVMNDATNATWNFVVIMNGVMYANSSWFGKTINPSQSLGTVTIQFDGSTFTLTQNDKGNVKTIGSTDADAWVNFGTETA